MSISTRNNVRISRSGTLIMALARGFGCAQSMWRSRARPFAGEYMQRMLPASTRHLIEHGEHCPRLNSPGASVTATALFSCR